MSEFNEIIEIVNKAKKMGYKDISKNGSMLYGHVPHVAPDAWFHILYAPLNKEEIIELEHKTKIDFPKTFIDFLEFSNGINLFSGEIVIYGLRKNYSRTGDDIWQPFDLDVPNIDERPKDAKESYLFVGSYYDDGSKLFIDCTDEKVYRCDPDVSSKKYNVWGNFSEMLISEAKRLENFFDENGRLKDLNNSTTPKPNF